MAMADRRPLGLPVSSTHASPAFNAATLATEHVVKLPAANVPSSQAMDADLEPEIGSPTFRMSNNTSESQSPSDLSPTLRSISPDSLMNSGVLPKKMESSYSSRDSTPPTLGSGFSRPTFGDSLAVKKNKPASRVPIATGISTTIPVTGEKPKPEQEGDSSLEDDVLFAIFLILYEKDPEGAGMTVKQICDVLIERHPDMAQLSSKTSNLVSAKLNAYVKRVEKGDSNLKYALSREWADASPKRMVYVYRGLLTQDFHVHVKQAMELQKLQLGSLRFVNGQENIPADPLEAAKQSALQKPRRLTMYDLGLAKFAFSETPERANWFVPYLSAPVAANLTSRASDDVVDLNKPISAFGEETPVLKEKIFNNDSDFELDDLEVFNDTDDDRETDILTETLKKSGKRSKSMSCLQLNKKHRFVTAAAAAPRAPKTPCPHSANAAAAADALHAAALEAISSSRHGSFSYASSGSSESQKSNWELAVRLGFMSKVIEAPEDLSLSDLDKLFG
ncbi:hypothetical protein PUMCH_003159 [Australozyma saopauloensis]|uniref:GDS1 winged helix domain-containing protein n=1 Tax=Australozyma saopauloensis TaxID=291208 RepID=A0AAX4HBI8_9ASCO|nr:hypothetical protein PUMCH_003159 [[Candida] saopauloensis]